MTPRFVLLFHMAVREFFYNRMAAFFTLVFPLVCVIAFGHLWADGSPPRLRVAVVGTGLEPMVGALEETPWIQVVKHPTWAGLDPGERYDGLLWITNGASAPAVLHADPVRAAMLATALDAAAARAAGHEERPYRIEPQPPPPSSFFMLLPGLVAMALLQLGLQGTAKPMLLARQGGALRTLALTPLPQSTFLLAHLALRIPIGALQIAAMSAAASLFFGVPGAPGPQMIVVSAIGIVMFTCLGFWIGGSARTQQGGHAAVTYLNLGLLFLGGVFFAPRGPLAFVAQLTPIGPLADALRQLMFGAPGALPLWGCVLAMLGWTAVALVVSLRTFAFDLAEQAAR